MSHPLKLILELASRFETNQHLICIPDAERSICQGDDTTGHGQKQSVRMTILGRPPTRFCRQDSERLQNLDHRNSVMQGVGCEVAKKWRVLYSLCTGREVDPLT